MSDLTERVRDVLPSVRRDLEDLVRIQSVWADPGRRAEVQRSAQAVADLLSRAGFDDVKIVSEGGAPAVIARHPAPPGRRPSCCTPTTTSSPRVTTPSGRRRRLIPRNAMAGSTAVAARTTRRASQRMSRRSARTVAGRRWA